MQFHARSAMVTHHRVVDGAALERNLHHVAARLFHALLHSCRHFLGLALTHANAAVTVANHGQCSEAEDTATLHNLGDAVDRDHFFAQTVVTTFVLHLGGYFCHFVRSA